MHASHSKNPPHKRDLHPLHLIVLIVWAVLAFPLVLYLIFMFGFLLMPGGFD